MKIYDIPEDNTDAFYAGIRQGRRELLTELLNFSENDYYRVSRPVIKDDGSVVREDGDELHEWLFRCVDNMNDIYEAFMASYSGVSK